MISRDQGLSFSAIWGESYDLNFGNYEDTRSGVYSMQYIGYFGATVINVVLMLNLLISILGDSYDRFQLEQAVVDIKEKAKISMELQSMMFWSNKQSLLKCIRLCNSAFQNEKDEDWEGRIRFMDKKLDKNIKEMVESNKVVVAKANENSKALEETIDKSLKGKFGSMEGKMSDISESLQDKISSIESKFCDISTSLDGKITDISTSLEAGITSMERKMRDLSTSLDDKISTISTSLEGKIASVEGKMINLNEKLEIILSIISK